MTYREQLDMACALEYDHEDEREEQIRELAVKAAEYNDPYSRYMYALPPTQRPYLWSDALVPPSSVPYRTIAINLHPSLRGFTRVLVAEEIIRKQLGDK